MNITLSQCTVYEWYVHFSQGEYQDADAPRESHSLCVDDKELLLTIEVEPCKLAKHLELFCTAIESHLHQLGQGVQDRQIGTSLSH